EVWREIMEAPGPKLGQKARFVELMAAVAPVLQNHLADLGQIRRGEPIAKAEIELGHRFAERLLHIVIKQSPNRLPRQKLERLAGQVDVVAVVMKTRERVGERGVLDEQRIVEIGVVKAIVRSVIRKAGHVHEAVPKCHRTDGILFPIPEY